MSTYSLLLCVSVSPEEYRNVGFFWKLRPACMYGWLHVAAIETVVSEILPNGRMVWIWIFMSRWLDLRFLNARVQHHHSGPHEKVGDFAVVENTGHFDDNRLGRLTGLSHILSGVVRARNKMLGTWLVMRCFSDKPRALTRHSGVSYACLLVPVVHLPLRAEAGALGKGIVRAPWDREFMALDSAHLKALDFKRNSLVRHFSPEQHEV